MDYSSEDKAGALKKLPKALADYVQSPRLSETFAAIQKKFNLNLRQIAAAAEITTLTLSALKDQAAFRTNLEHALPELAPTVLEALTGEIEETIFKEARNALKNSTLPQQPESV